MIVTEQSLEELIEVCASHSPEITRDNARLLSAISALAAACILYIQDLEIAERALEMIAFTGPASPGDKKHTIAQNCLDELNLRLKEREQNEKEKVLHT